MKSKSILDITLSSLISFLLFLLFLGILNSVQMDNDLILRILNFLNQNLWLIILFSIFFYLGEIFSVFKFPINIPMPILNAIGGIYLVHFLFEILYEIDKAFLNFASLELLVISLVLIFTILFGYLSIYEKEKKLDYKKIKLINKNMVKKSKKTVAKEQDNTLAIITHAIGIFSSVFGALLVFVLTKDREVKKHAKNALNWQISLIVYLVVLFLLSVVSLFLMRAFSNVYILFPFSFVISVLQILNIVFCIVAAFKASEGEIWKYPLSINFIGMINEKDIEKGKKELKKTYKKVKSEIKKELKTKKKK